MDKKIIRRANQIIRANRPAYLTYEICSEHYSANSLEIAFLSKRCRNDANGSCIMCDYGYSQVTHTDEEYLSEMQKILTKYQNLDSVLLCTNGSILDENQVSTDLFEKILKVAAGSNVKEIQIETHYNNISKTKLELIKSICSNKVVTIELGFETANIAYQDTLIMKNIKLDEFEKTLN